MTANMITTNRPFTRTAQASAVAAIAHHQCRCRARYQADSVHRPKSASV